MFTLKISSDTNPTNPRTDCDNASVMVCFHGRYNLGDEHDIDYNDFQGWEAREKHIVKEWDAVAILPLYLYNHSGLSISTSPFSCSWDSGQIGFIYIDRKTLLSEAPGKPKIVTKKAREWAFNYLEKDVEIYDQYLTGDVYGYEITEEGEVVYACWGMYGEDYCRAEGEAALAGLQLKVAA